MLHKIQRRSSARCQNRTDRVQSNFSLADSNKLLSCLIVTITVVTLRSALAWSSLYSAGFCSSWIQLPDVADFHEIPSSARTHTQKHTKVVKVLGPAHYLWQSNLCGFVGSWDKESVSSMILSQTAHTCATDLSSVHTYGTWPSFAYCTWFRPPNPRCSKKPCCSLNIIKDAGSAEISPGRAA